MPRRLTYRVLTLPPMHPTPRRQQLAATQTPRLKQQPSCVLDVDDAGPGRVVGLALLMRAATLVPDCDDERHSANTVQNPRTSPTMTTRRGGRQGQREPQPPCTSDDDDDNAVAGWPLHQCETQHPCSTIAT